MLELEHAKAGPVTRPVAALVLAEKRPAAWPVFARAGFEVAWEGRTDVPAVADAVIAALETQFAGRPKAWILQAWVPDSDASNPLSAQADELEAAVARAIAAKRPELGLRRLEAA